MSTTITGKLENLGQGNVSSGTFVRFYLRGAGGNQPRVDGTAIIAPTLGNVYYFDFVPNASGVISGTLWSTRDVTGLLGGDIEVGGVTTAVWYGMVVFSNGKAGPETPIHAKNTATIDISNVTPITTNPVVTAPTGDSTYARLDGGNQPFTGNVSVGTHSITAGTAIFGGAAANPWIDVTHPTYGAKCDGVTNDAVAIQAAITACHALGNSCRVVIPAAVICNINSGLSNFSGVSIEGQSTQSSQFAPRIRYTASGTTPAISCGTAACNVAFKNIEFTYSSASFTGVLVSNTGASSNLVMDGVVLTSDTSLLNNAAYLLDLTNSNSNFLTRCQFGSATKGINLTGSTLNSITNSIFGGSFGTFTSTYIDNPLAGVNLIGNDFEFISEPTTGGPVMSCATGCFSSLVAGNWIGDFPTTWVGSLFKGTHGVAFIGNTFSGPASGTGGTLFDNSATGSTTSYSVVGNTTLGVWAAVFNHNAAVKGIEVTGNAWSGTLTAFMSGTAPASGIAFDPSGKNIIPMLMANGSSAAPSYSFAANTNQGLMSTGTFAQMVVNGFGNLAWDGSGNSYQRQNGVFGWPSAAGDPAGGTLDTGVSRVAANVVGVGNGTAANVTGEIRSAKISATYNAAGTVQTAVHLVVDTCTLGTSCGITLTGSAAFTSATSYTCTCHDQTTPLNACGVNQTGGGALTITGTGTDVIRYLCIGN